MSSLRPFKKSGAKWCKEVVQWCKEMVACWLGCLAVRLHLGSSSGVVGSTELLPPWWKKGCAHGNVCDGEWGLGLGFVLKSLCFRGIDPEKC